MASAILRVNSVIAPASTAIPVKSPDVRPVRVSSSVNDGIRTGAFPIRLHALISDAKSNKGSIEWSLAGDEFVITNLEVFKRDVLVSQLGISYNGFIRALMKYGFVAVKGRPYSWRRLQFRRDYSACGIAASNSVADDVAMKLLAERTRVRKSRSPPRKSKCLIVGAFLKYLCAL